MRFGGWICDGADFCLPRNISDKVGAGFEVLLKSKNN
jgi:hypothetical protein